MGHDSPFHRQPRSTPLDRREFLWRSGGGLGGLALASLLGADRAWAAPGKFTGCLHHPPKAKRVVQFFMAGAASHLDLFDFKPGWPTTFGGVRALRNNIAQFHCPFAERIEKGGAILLGKTNSPVMGLRGVCDNYLFGATRNPHDLSRSAAGSSGGAAAALASGTAWLAHGSDMGGSLRNPAAFNNIFGFRPSYGRVASQATDVFYAAMGVQGPLARTIPDLAMLLSVQAGYDFTGWTGSCSGTGTCCQSSADTCSRTWIV